MDFSDQWMMDNLVCCIYDSNHQWTKEYKHSFYPDLNQASIRRKLKDAIMYDMAYQVQLLSDGEAEALLANFVNLMTNSSGTIYDITFDDFELDYRYTFEFAVIGFCEKYKTIGVIYFGDED
jgi:hypothetical protein